MQLQKSIKIASSLADSSKRFAPQTIRL